MPEKYQYPAGIVAGLILGSFIFMGITKIISMM